jgi:hypothetical protein
MPSPGTQGNRPKTTLNCSTRFDDANRFYCKLTSDKSSLYEITIDRNHCTESRTGRLDGLDQTSYQASCDPQFPVLEEFLSPSPSSSAPSSAIFSGKSGSFPFLKVAAAALAVFCSYQAFRASKAAKGDANEKSAQERDDAQKRARLYGAAAAASFVAILFV